MLIKQKLFLQLNQIMKDFKLDIKFDLVHNPNFGNLSTNMALKIAHKLKKPPLKVAQVIVNKINQKEYQIKKIEIIGIGFINFYLMESNLVKIINNILKVKKEYGVLTNIDKKYINVEYVSANPTGYLHLGHARNAIVGSTLINILRFVGHKVDSEYYVNDLGKQIKQLGQSVQKRYQQLFKPKLIFQEQLYQGQDIIDVAKIIKQEFNDKYLTSDSFQPKDFFETYAKNWFLKQIKQDLKNIMVEFDLFTFESDLIKQNLIQQTLLKLKDKYQKDKAIFLATSKYGDDKDRVLIKKDGNYTYFLPDIAFHILKINRGYDYLINVLGVDHIGYLKRMQIALQQLGFKNKLKTNLIIQTVHIFQNQKSQKMSKRSGNTYTIKTALKTLKKDNLRFFLITMSCDSKLNFNIDQINFHKNKNDLIYIKYAYARASQLLLKSTKQALAGELLLVQETQLINILNKFPELIKQISQNYKIHLLAKYLINLAKKFHSYYNFVKIIASQNESNKLALVQAIKQVIANGLKLLAIEPKERI